MRRPLRIGINALYLIPQGVGGTEIYLRHLLRALSQIDTYNQYYVFTNRETGTSLTPAADNFHTRIQPISAVWRPGRLLWEQLGLPLAVWRQQLDCLLNPGFTAPFFSPAPSVSVFHDLQHVRRPECFRPWDLPFWKLFLYGSAHRSKAIIAVSTATQRDILTHYKLPPEQVHVVPHGVGDEFFQLFARRGPVAPFLLYVSTLHPHKNHLRLLRAFARAACRFPHFRLVCAGLRGFATAQVEQEIQRLGLNSRVILTGWIADQELLQLYRTAAACIYPSTFEGFGIPVLEAMAAGIPLACSRIEPLASLAQDCALLFDPWSEKEMVEVLETLMSGAPELHRLAAKARERAHNFRWEMTARLTLRVLSEACAKEVHAMTPSA